MSWPTSPVVDQTYIVGGKTFVYKGNNVFEQVYVATEETDPVFTAWKGAVRNANTVFAGPLSGAAAAATWRKLNYSELDGLPTLNTANWDTAFGWGNHATAGYLTALPNHTLIGTHHTVSGLTSGHFLKATGATTYGFAAHGLTASDVSALASNHAASGVTTTKISNWDTAHGWGDHALAGYLTSLPAHALNNHTDVSITTPASGQLIRHNGTGWANWTPNYLTSFSETDPVFVAFRDAARTANTIYSGPASGTSAAATFRAMVTADIPNKAVTYAKIQDVTATSRILGRIATGAGVIEELTGANVRTIINVADGANNYTHPTNHPPSIITQDLNNRFVTDAQISAWNGKPNLGETISTAYRGDRGKIAYDHSQTDHAPSNANYYVHPTTHPPTIIVQDASNRFVTDVQIGIWNGKPNLGETSATAYRGDHGLAAYNHSLSAHLALGETSGTAYRGDRGKAAYDHSLTAHAPSNANYYVHPDNHPPSIITQDLNNRFVTDAQISAWNGKPNLGETISTAYRGDRGKIAYDHSQTAHLALGETLSTAYRGDRGKIAYDHSQTAHDFDKYTNWLFKVKTGTDVSVTSGHRIQFLEGDNITITQGASTGTTSIQISAHAAGYTWSSAKYVGSGSTYSIGDIATGPNALVAGYYHYRIHVIFSRPTTTRLAGYMIIDVSVNIYNSTHYNSSPKVSVFSLIGGASVNLEPDKIPVGFTNAGKLYITLKNDTGYGYIYLKYAVQEIAYNDI